MHQNTGSNLLRGEAVPDGECEYVDDLARVRAEQVRTEDAPCRGESRDV